MRRRRVGPGDRMPDRRWWAAFAMVCSVGASAFLSASCKPSGPPPLVVGVDRGMEPVGLVRFLAAGFEDETKIRVKIRYGGTDELLAWANAGDLDVVFVTSEDSLTALEAEGLPLRAQTYAHEELVLIGPFQDYLGRHAKASGAKLLQNVARSNYRYLRAKEGSVERARHERLFRQGGDRIQPGSFFESKLAGEALVRSAIDTQAFALVKRSSLLAVIRSGVKPHRVYKESDPGLVLRLVLAEIHPGKTRRAVRPEFFDYVMGTAGQEAIASFGRERFGYPLFGPGAPPAGEGAGVPGLNQGRARATAEP